ncbi:MAG TPA: TraX family protein [Gammaproteobacteria bacterium]|nr:TraX family protein [Gammaproteobacteria bacterium]
MVARNVGRSSNPEGYVKRLVLWGVVAQPIFWLAFHSYGFRLSVLLSLALIVAGCLSLRLPARQGLLAVAVFGTLAHWCDYGTIGYVFG